MHIAESVRTAAHAAKSEALALEQKAGHFASSLIEGDRSKKRRGGSGLVWHWHEHRRTAHGCAEDYIEIGDGHGIRHWYTGNHTVEKVPDAVLLLTEGVPVMYYNPADRLFERRVLKVDNMLSFMYVLIDPVGMKGALHAGEGSPITLRLNRVLSVWGGTDAMRIMDELAIEDPHLSIESSIVVQFGDKDVATPSIDKLFVFMAAPQQNLQKSIEACVQSERMRSSVMDPTATPSDSPHRDPPQKAGAGAGKRRGSVAGQGQVDKRRVNGVVLRDMTPIFSREADGIDLQVLLRPDNEPVTLRLAADLDSVEDSDAIVVSAAKEISHEFASIDRARISFVHRDVASLREWATLRLPGVFRGKLWTYVQDPCSLQAVVPQDEGFRDATEQTQHTLELAPRSDAGRVWEQSVRSSWRALQQLLQLETDFAMLLERGRALGIPACDAAASTTMALSGVALRGTPEADTLPSEQAAEGLECFPADGLSNAASGERPPAPLGVLGEALEQEHTLRSNDLVSQGALPSDGYSQGGLPSDSAAPTPTLPGHPGPEDSARGTWASFEQRNKTESARSICGSETFQGLGPEPPCGIRRRGQGDGHGDEPCISACIGVRDPKCTVQ